MSNTFKKTIQHYFDFAKKHKLSWIDPAPLINEVDHKAFNYSLEEPILRRFGGYFDITEKYNFSTIQPCIRGADVAAIKRHQTKKHLSLFHIMPTNFYLSPYPKKLPEMQPQGIKNTLTFLDSLGIDLSRLLITYFPGGYLDEISQGTVPVHKYFQEDIITVNAFCDFGLRENQLLPVSNLSTFVATFPGKTDFYAGNRFEIFYTFQQDKIIEIGSGESLKYRQIQKNGITSDIIDANCSIAAIVLGLERLQSVVEKHYSVFKIESMLMLAKEIIRKNKKKINLETALEIVDALRAAHLVLAQLGSNPVGKYFKEQKRIIISRCCHLLQINSLLDEELILFLLQNNASFYPWLSVLNIQAERVGTIITSKVKKRENNYKH